MAEIDAALVRSLFDYDPISGVLTRRPCIGTHGRPFPITHSRDPRGYLKTRIDDREYFVHRLVWMYVYETWPRYEIDHRNRDPRDNRVENLRDVPRAENIANRRSWAKNLPRKRPEQGPGKNSAYGTVFLDIGAKPYRARVQINGKRINVGRYVTQDEAWAALEAHKQRTGTASTTHIGANARAAPAAT